MLSTPVLDYLADKYTGLGVMKFLYKHASACDPLTCSICIDSVHTNELYTVLPCAHYFHRACLLLWMDVKDTCPECRASFLPDNTDEFVLVLLNRNTAQEFLDLTRIEMCSKSSCSVYSAYDLFYFYQGLLIDSKEAPKPFFWQIDLAHSPA
ncbi:hypothetical protein NECID01_1483 [Nematocida sp. AWRm77]|nr:hypothetical protein NECID01_1483 [Nematocida sp. AWRm77]